MSKIQKVHLDTDFGGDIDDICALALLLKSSGVKITGITTVAENGGKRAGQVKYTLKVANKTDIPIRAGVDNSDGYYAKRLGLLDEKRYWPEPISPLKNVMDEALELLKQSIDQKATIIAIGPLTNLYLLDVKYPGILRQAEIFYMGGYITSPRPGFPEWKNDWDFNTQIDVRSAKHVLTNSNVTLVQLSVTGETFLREADLILLQKSGPLGNLLTQQAEEFAKDEKMAQKYKDCENVPKDVINFQYDPLTAAIALGWNEDVFIEEYPLTIEEKNGLLYERIDNSGKNLKVVTRINGNRFSEFWLDQVTSR